MALQIVIPTLSFFAAFCLLLLLPSQWRARNIPILCLIGWLFLCNTYRGVDSLLWSDNVDIKWVVWCDITTKLAIGASFGISASAMSICRYLYLILTLNSTKQTDRQRKWQRITELFLCLGTPVIAMALHYISQGHRFNILQYYGCDPATFHTWVSIFTLRVPPFLSAIGGMVYACLALFTLHRHRMSWRKLQLEQRQHALSASFTAHQAAPLVLNPRTHLRLTIIAVSEIVLDFAVNIYVLVLDLKVEIHPYVSWEEAHWGFSRIDQYPYSILSPTWNRETCILWAVIPAASLVFVGCFVVGGDNWWGGRLLQAKGWFSKVILRKPASPDLQGNFDLEGGLSARIEVGGFNGGQVAMADIEPKSQLSTPSVIRITRHGESQGRTDDAGRGEDSESNDEESDSASEKRG